LEIKFCDRNQENGEPEENETDPGDEPSEDDDKLHLYRLRFPQADLVAIHSYMDLWHADRLAISENFQRHLNLEASGVYDDLDDTVGPCLLHESSILDDRHAREVNRSLPLKIQNQSWCLAYSTRINGFSLQNLYRTISDEKDPFLVVIQDANGFVFGAYLTCTPRISETFIGTGKSWIFSFGRLQFPDPAVDPEEEGETPAAPMVANPHHLNVFHWSGRNEYFFQVSISGISISAGTFSAQISNLE
jgi:hypothetical protein